MLKGGAMMQAGMHDGVDRVRRAAAIPVEAGPAIISAPARGGFVLLPPARSDADTEYVMTPRGYAKVRPIRTADVFDLMAAQAARRKADAPLSPGQVAIARHYRSLVEILSAGGCKLSDPERASGGGRGRDWMDRRLQISAEVEMLRDRMGNGPALAVRRLRKDGAAVARRTIRTRYLVDAVCLHDRTLDRVLRGHGWSTKSPHLQALLEALCGSLDRMIGYRARKED